MTEQIRKVLRDSKAARWTALFIVSITMFAGYYIADVMSPLKPMLENQLHWNSADYGFFTGAYGWFNVFFLFLLFGGIILDKMGIRFTGMASAIIMVIGASLKYWALSTHALDGQTWNLLFWSYPAQVWIAGIGFAIFGMGIEVSGITVTKIIVKWFKGYEIALAMGIQVGIARLGTALALGISLPIARWAGYVSFPVLCGLLLLVIGLLAFVVYMFQDKKLDVSEANAANQATDPEEEFKFSDILSILKNKAWWYLTILCALFYSGVFAFLKYATDLMINKYGVTENLAGLIPSVMPFGTILLTPIFGGIYDKKGKGATIMVIGSLILILVHLIFSLPIMNHYLVAVSLMIILGISFSLVPSAMWPSVPKFIPEKQLGTAYGLIFLVQNAIALMAIPAIIGMVLDKWCVISTSTLPDGSTMTAYDYQVPMFIFTGIGVLALVFALLLKVEDRKKGYGLELPNSK